MLLRPTKKKNDVEAQTFPNTHNDQRQQCIMRISQPVNGMDTKPAHKVVDQPIVTVEHPIPNHRNRHSTGDKRQEIDGSEETGDDLHLV